MLNEICLRWSEIIGKSSKTPSSACLYNKKNITRRLEDMNFIFSWQNKIYIFAPPCNILYISNVHSYNTRSCASNNFYTRPSRLSIQANSFSRIGVEVRNTIPQALRDLPKNAFKRKPEDFRRFSKIVPKARQTFPNIFREFPKISEDVRRFPMIAEDFRGRPEDVSMIHQRI